MKKALLIILFAATGTIAAAQNNPKPEEQIRKYWFVMLLKGPVRNQDSVTAAKIQK